MNVPIKACILVFIGLFLTSLVLQFIRAKKREKLVRMADPSMFTDVDKARWETLDNQLISIFRDFRKLQLLKRNTSAQDQDIIERLAYYRRFSRVEISVTSAMILFALFAHKICE